MQASSSFSSSLPITVGTASSNVANIETDGTNAMTLSGVLSGSGGLTKIGSGSLMLTGGNTYSGTTTISGGTLQLGNGTSGNDGSLTSTSINNSARAGL